MARELLLRDLVDIPYRLDTTMDTKGTWNAVHREELRRIWETRTIVPASRSIESPYRGRTPRIRQYREQVGLSQRQLARETGLASGHISGYESRKRYPSRATAIRLAEFFGCEPDDLYEPDESEHAA